MEATKFGPDIVILSTKMSVRTTNHSYVVVLTLILVESMTISGPNIVSMVV